MALSLAYGGGVRRENSPDGWLMRRELNQSKRRVFGRKPESVSIGNVGGARRQHLGWRLRNESVSADIAVIKAAASHRRGISVGVIIGGSAGGSAAIGLAAWRTGSGVAAQCGVACSGGVIGMQLIILASRPARRPRHSSAGGLGGGSAASRPRSAAGRGESYVVIS
jgi:hypothetical protein